MNRNLKNSGKLLLSFLLILAMIIPSMNIRTNAATMNFTDVPANAWYKSSVQYCFDRGYMSGTNQEKTLFSPTANLNRGMMVSILWNIAGKPAAKKTTNFTDIKGTTAYYYKAVQWAAENKVVSGFADGSFGPSKNISREQLASMLRNFAKYRGKDTTNTTSLSAFKDASKISSYAKDSVAWAVAYKIISGKSGGTMVDPKGNATRAEAAAMIKSYCDNVEAVKTTNEGKVLNIMLWNDEFALRMRYYPGFKAKDEEDILAGGTIGDVKVNFHQFYLSSEDGNTDYVDVLTKRLNSQATTAVDQRIDMFILDDSFRETLIENPNVMDISKLLTTDDTKNMYPYTKDLGTNSKGVLKAVSWQICPSVMYYNKNIAAEVFGYTDPVHIQNLVTDWASFNYNAERVKMYGYNMTGSYEETLRQYLQSRTTGWVKDGKGYIDAKVIQWLEDTNNLFNQGLTTDTDIWSSYFDEAYGFTSGNAFCGFGPEWLYLYCLGYEWMGGNMNPVNNHALGVCAGPEAAYWGGSFIGVSSQTDNQTLVKNILKTMTCDQKHMKMIADETYDLPNNMAAMSQLAASKVTNTMLLDMMGGDNPYGIYDDVAKRINAKNRVTFEDDMYYSVAEIGASYIRGECLKDEAIERIKEALLRYM